MKTIVKFLMNDISKASRDKREIATLLRMGNKVIIVCPRISNENEEIIKSCEIIKYEPPNISYQQNKIQRYFVIVRHWFNLAGTLRKLPKDCISCHDMNALFIGWMSTFGIINNKRPLLVYDSHEYEAGRNSARSKFRKRIIILTENFLIKRSAFSIMVNDSIANKVQDLHRLKKKPFVIRNLPNYWEIDRKKCLQKHQEFCKALKMPEDTFLVMYHGGIIENRGIENVLNSISAITNVAAIIVGDGDAGYIQKLKKLIQDIKLNDRVLFHEAVPVDTLWEYVGAADLGMVLIRNTCENHYLSLPNKLFENIQSGTPVLTSDFPELRNIVNTYQIGMCCDPENITEIAEKIQYIKNHKDLYLQFKNNALNAKGELHWDVEQSKLANAYSRIFSDK